MSRMCDWTLTEEEIAAVSRMLRDFSIAFCAPNDTCCEKLSGSA